MNDKIAKKTFDVDTCILCGCAIPEGGHVCNSCLEKYDDDKNDIAISNNKNKNNRNNRNMLYRKNEWKKVK